MTTPKTLEEPQSDWARSRAYRWWMDWFGGIKNDTRGINQIAVMLREAADTPPIDPKVLVEWYRNDAGFHHLVDALASQRLDGAQDAARQEEREACAQIADPVDDVLAEVIRRRSRLDARSRGEEPKPDHEFWFDAKTIYRSGGSTPCGGCGLPESAHRKILS